MIYVIDADETVRALVVHIAQVAEGTAVRQFARASEARDAISLAVATGRALPALVVMAFDDPPSGSGPDLCRWLKSLPMLRDMPILALARVATDDGAAVLQAFSAGATEFVRKPLDPFELQARLPATIRAGKVARARGAAEGELRRELAFTQAMVDSLSNMGQGLMVIEQGRISYVNPALCTLTGYTADTLYNRNSFLDLFHPDEQNRIAGNHQRRITGEIFESCYDTALQGADGARIDIEFSVARFNAPPHNGVACLIRDIRSQIDMQRRLRHLADFDQLTGLPNRRVLHDRLVHALTRATRASQRLALLFIDLDGFKAVNDQYGHAAGDALLREVAERLRAGVRASDTVARLAGDEFVVILEPDAETGIDPVPVTEKLLVALRAPYALDCGIAHVTASIGIVRAAAASEDADTLLHLADQAMYRAKQAGKNKYVLIERG